MSRKRRSHSAMDLDASQSVSDVSMQGSSSTIRGGSFMQIDEGPEINLEATSREKKIQILTAADMEPRHRQRIHDLEDIVASKNAELESAALEVKSRENTITALEHKILSMRSFIEEAQEQFREQQVLNQGAWAKAEDLDKTRQKLLEKNIELIGHVYDLAQEVKLLNRCLATQSEPENSTVHSLEVKWHDLKVQMAVLMQTNSMLSSANAELQQTVESLKKLSKKLKDEDIAKLETSLANSVSKCDGLENSIESLKESYETEMLSLQNSHNSSDDLTKQVSGLQSDCARLHETIALLQQQKTEMDVKISVSSKEFDRLMDKNTLLCSELANAQSAQVSPLSKYEKEQLKYCETEEKFHKADHEKTILEEDNQQLLNDSDLLKEDHDALKTKHQDQDKELEIQDSKRMHHKSVAMHELQIQQKDQELRMLQLSLDETIELDKNTFEQTALEVQDLQSIVDEQRSMNDLNDSRFKQEEFENLQIALQDAEELLVVKDTELKDGYTELQEMSNKFANTQKENMLLMEQIKDLKAAWKEKDDLQVTHLPFRFHLRIYMLTKQQTLQQSERDTLRTNIDTLQFELGEAHTHSSGLEDELTGARQANQTLVKGKAELISKSDDQTEVIQKLVSEKTKIKQQMEDHVAAASQMLQKLTDEKDALIRQSTGNHHKAQELHQQSADNRRKVEDLALEKEELIRQLEDCNAAAVRKLDNEKREVEQQLVVNATMALQTVQKLTEEKEALARQCTDDCLKAQTDGAESLQKIQDLDNEQAKLVQQLRQQELEIRRLQEPGRRNEDDWIARPRYDVLLGQLEAAQAIHEKVQGELRTKSNEVEAAVQQWNDFAMESQDLCHELNTRNQEVETLKKDNT
ncbi:hypothetical protein EV368DRAFT_82903 [Lentinula lateritia]|nr:hypothetical protein EV368DRAFT_82903 [Lentinula lateritia]